MHNIHSTLPADNSYVQDGKKVTIRGNAEGATTQVTPEELEHLHNNAVFNLHKANGFITVTDAGETFDDEDAPTDESGAVLKGSNKQPDSFTLEDGSDILIVDVVLRAQELSGLTPEKWNALKQKERESLIAEVVSELPLKQE